VYAFTVGITIAATLLFAVAPACRLSAAGSSEAMKEGSSAAGTRNRLRSSLVVVQVALSLALLVAAGLCMVSLKRIEAFNPGFRKDGVLLASLDLFPAGYSPARGQQVLSEVLDALQAIPGVTSYTLARHVPLGFTGLSSSSIDVEGRQSEPNKPDVISFTAVGPNYLDVMNIPLVAGRDIVRSDRRESPPVAVISETMAKQFWPSKDAVGARFRFGSNSDWITVIGVARDVKWRDVKENSRRFAYLPVLQSYNPNTVIHLRTAGDPVLLAPAVRDAVAKVVPELPVFSIRTLSGHVGASTFQQSMASTLLAAFGGLALILAALGLYGVLAFVVSQRTREIGIRIAVGAKPDDVFRMIVRQGLTLTIIGILLGIAAAYALGSAMSSLLFGVSASDPVILGAGSALMLLTALAACLIPAKRAIRVDPVASLRCE
jgi:putative ABC transport system permease protein